MNLLGAVFRFFLLTLLFTFIVGVLLFPFMGVPGLIGGIGFAGFIFLAMSSSAESYLSQIYHAKRLKGSRLEYLLRLTGGLHRKKNPHYYLYPDPSVQMLVARPLGSPGCIFLSEGALLRLSERQLQSALCNGVILCRKFDVFISTIASCLATVVWRGLPVGWRHLIYKTPETTLKARLAGRLTPFQALRFMLFFPFVHLLLYLGKRSSPTPSLMENTTDPLMSFPELNRPWLDNPALRALHEPFSSR